MAEITSALTASGYKSLCVYNDRLELLGRIESWLSLVWPERYNFYSNVQGAQLELHDTTALQALCRPDRYLWLVGSDRLMRIVSAQKADHKLVLYTKDAACILDERVSTGTLSSFAVEDTLRGLVSGAAAWPCGCEPPTRHGRALVHASFPSLRWPDGNSTVGRICTRRKRWAFLTLTCSPGFMWRLSLRWRSVSAMAEMMATSSSTAATCSGYR